MLGYKISNINYKISNMPCRMFNKSLILATVFCIIIVNSSVAQKPDFVNTTQLCMNHYFTEEQGQKFIENQLLSYKNKTGWEKRAALVREKILQGSRLNGVKINMPLNAVVHSKKVFEGYSVENVFFESVPGFYVTGNLYKPSKQYASYAALLCPHGHWDNARLDTAMQILCANLAKMGAIVFTYDMIGYGESTQCQHDYPHTQLNGLQTINSIRSLDFILSLPKVDAKRVGVTGASGGGTQTFLLAALDKRVAAAAPIVMVGASFFGGCTCESGMPIHRDDTENYQTCNAEIAGLIAPRPLLLVSNGDDWTYKTPTVEYPYLKSIYQFYNSGQKVENAHFAKETHDYGPSKRAAAYHFFAKNLRLSLSNILDKKGSIDEESITILSQEKLHVFDEQYKRPVNAVLGNEAVEQLFNNIKRNK